MMGTDDFAEAAREEAKEQCGNDYDAENFIAGWEAARTYLADQEPTDAEVDAARAAYWPAYSEAVRNAPSNRPGQGISAEDGRKAGLAGHRAALSAARAVGRGAR